VHRRPSARPGTVARAGEDAREGEGDPGFGVLCAGGSELGLLVELWGCRCHGPCGCELKRKERRLGIRVFIRVNDTKGLYI